MIKKTILIVVASLALLMIIILINGIFNISEVVYTNFYLTNRNPKYYFIPVLIMLAFLFIIAKRMLRLNSYKLNHWHFVLVFFLFLLKGSAVIVLSDVDLTYDPKGYFESGVLIAENLENLTITNIFHQRALFYTAPILYIFPTALKSLQIVNLFLLFTSMIIFCSILYKEYGKHVAFYFIVLFTIYFEFYTAILIASHDLAFIFYFSLLSYTLYKLFTLDSNLLKYFLIFIAAVLIIIIDFQRTVKFPIILALILILGFQLKNLKSIFINDKAKSIFLLIVITSIFSITVQKLTSKLDHIDIEDMLYSYNELGGSGDVFSGKENRSNFLSLLQKKDKEKLTYLKLANQISHYPFTFLRVIHKKATNFTKTTWNFPGMNSYFFFFKGINSHWTTQFILTLCYSLFKIICFVFAIVGLLEMISKQSSIISKHIYLLFPIILTPMLLTSELNSYYFIIVYPFLCIYAAFGMKYILKLNFKFKFNFKTFFIPTCVILGFLLSLFALSQVFINYNESSLVDFNKSKIEFLGLTPENKIFTSPFAQTLLINENSKLIPQLSFTNATEISSISFFLKTSDKSEDLNIYFNGKRILPVNSQANKTLNIKYFNYYYNYYKYDFNNSTKTIYIDFENLSSKFTIKDIVLN